MELPGEDIELDEEGNGESITLGVMTDVTALKVVVDFGMQVQWIALSRSQALHLAEMIREAAQKLDEER